jgi:hypothetical protein
MSIISSVQKAIDNVKMMDVKNISSTIMKFFNPKLYLFQYSDKNVIHRQSEDEDAFIGSIQKAYIFATCPKEAFLIYMHYCQSLNLTTLYDTYFTLTEFEKYLKVVNENIKHFTIPRIESLQLLYSCQDNIDRYSYINKYQYKSSKDIKKLLYKCVPLVDFDDIENNNYIPGQLYVNSTNKSCTIVNEFDDMFIYDEEELITV